MSPTDSSNTEASSSPSRRTFLKGADTGDIDVHVSIVYQWANGTYLGRNTLMAIIGREVGSRGAEMSNQVIENRDLDLRPKTYAWGDAPPAVGPTARSRPESQSTAEGAGK